MKVSVSKNRVSGIDTHFLKYHIGGINTFGIVSPITKICLMCPHKPVVMCNIIVITIIAI